MNKSGLTMDVIIDSHEPHINSSHVLVKSQFKKRTHP